MLWLCTVTAECCDCNVTAECCDFALWSYNLSPGTVSVCHPCYTWCCIPSARVTYVILSFLSKQIQLCRKSQISLPVKRPQFLTDLHSLLPSFEVYTRAAMHDSCRMSARSCHSQMWCIFSLTICEIKQLTQCHSIKSSIISSGVWCCVGFVFLVIAKERSVSVSRVKQSETNVWSWSWRHHISLKNWWQHMQQHNVLSWESCLFHVITVRISNQNVFFIVGESMVLFSMGFMQNRKL
jgi:hypothetical protein